MVTVDTSATRRAGGVLADEELWLPAGELVPMLDTEEVPTTAGQAQQCILIIEDDRSVRDLLALRLTSSGYRILQAEDGWRGLDLLRAFPVDLVLLDIMLPSIDGWETMRRIRDFSLVPVLVLTARAQERDEVLGLSLGADDYVVKPFTFSRLKARIQAMLRRSSYGDNKNTDMIYRDKALTIDLWRRDVAVRAHRVELTPTEYRLLLSLVRHCGQVVGHDQLLMEVWGANYESVASLKAYVGYLRRKIEVNPSEPKLIHTSWGVGYRYEPPSDS